MMPWNKNIPLKVEGRTRLSVLEGKLDSTVHAGTGDLD